MSLKASNCASIPLEGYIFEMRRLKAATMAAKARILELIRVGFNCIIELDLSSGFKSKFGNFEKTPK